jgi:RNA polymerase sigma factor (sigma-70 family)
MDIADKELIQRTLNNGDQRAFNQLVLRYQSPLRSCIRRWCQDEALADDLAQETFIKAYNALSTFRGDAKFSTWLYRIAFNVSMSEQRKRGLVLLTEEQEQALEAQTSKHDDVALCEDLNNAMQHLTLAQQTLIDLCLNRGFSHQEAAEITGMALGTVKSHVNRGKAKLMSLLAIWQEDVIHG